jgi:hypothetical protein
MTNTDIVARLRQTHPVHCKCFGCEAAEEIALLRSQRDEARREAAAAQVDQRLIEELWERRTEMTEMKAQIKLLMKQRDLAEMHHSEISIHADVIIKEASALITRCVESRKASAYWNAVEQFRQFEIRIT